MIEPGMAMLTGGTRGIGAAIARELRDAGWTLALGVRDPARVPRGPARASPSRRRSLGGCRALLLASLSGLRVRNDRIACSEAKHAVVALGNTLRREGWDDGVRVCTVCPGLVRTDMTADTTKVPRAEMTAPEDLAHLARTVMGLPNTASVARLAVNCWFEDEY